MHPIHRRIAAMTADLEVGASRTISVRDVMAAVHYPSAQVRWWLRAYGDRCPQFSAASVDAVGNTWIITRIR